MSILLSIFKHYYLVISRVILFHVILLLSQGLQCQVLFTEECFNGGILTGGADTAGSIENVLCQIDWQEGYVIRKAFAVTYRYGRPAPFAMKVNEAEIHWNISSQAGPEQIETNTLSEFFAPHVKEITTSISIQSNFLSLDFPIQPFDGNKGWWGIYIIILYETPDILTDVCFRLYTASQSQLNSQHYEFGMFGINLSEPVVLALHSGRMANWMSDRSLIKINGATLGEIWQDDLVVPPTGSGVQGHFSYKNGEVLTFNGDTANTTVDKHDGTAIINSYLTSNPNQTLTFQPNLIPPQANPNPSFVIAYTPTCTPPTATMPRNLSFCRTETSEEARQLQAIAGYDHYNWSAGELVSDSTIANPVCYADSSGWFRVRMWNDDESGVCSQTIPVFVTVGQVPRPGRLFTRSSPCPNPTGRIAFEQMAGTPPFQFTVGGITQSDTLFTGLAAGSYPVSVVDALGCTWDSVAVIPHNPTQEAAFTANPNAGFTPLEVRFENQSSAISTGYQWLIDGEPFSSSQNTSYTFADSGTYQVALVAYYISETCTDTAFVTLRVDQGMELIIPNIISPNGDGRNDALVAQIAGVAELRWQVFNRWGQLMHSGEQTGLDGESQIELWRPEAERSLPDAPYTLTIQAIGSSGQRSEVASQVMVVE